MNISFKVILISLLCTCALNTVFAQTGCGETTTTLVEASAKTTLCTNGSDTVKLTYNLADNTSALPNYAYVVEGPNGLVFLEVGDPPLNIIPAQFNAIPGDTLCVSGFAYDIAQVNDLIATLSNGFLCTLAGIDAMTCQIIADLNAQGGLNSLNEALDFIATLGSSPPATTEEAIALLIDLDTQASALGGICVAVSNNGIGKDYCYLVENCCPAQQTISLDSMITTANNYIAETAVCLEEGFDTTEHFYAAIEDCP